MGEAFAQFLIPVAALVGIGFALLQWLLVSKVKVSADSDLSNRYSDRLIEEEEEGIDHEDVANKCSEIQNAISVGEFTFYSRPPPPPPSHPLSCLRFLRFCVGVLVEFLYDCDDDYDFLN